MERRARRRQRPTLGEGAKPRAIGYVRVSTEKQAESGAGLSDQETKIKAECQRNGWDLVEIVSEALSGKNIEKRPGLKEALHKLDTAQADILVTDKLDRLSRSIIDFHNTVERSKRFGWKLSVLDVAMDTSTPTGELMAGILAVFAQFERRMIGQRTKNALAVKKSEGMVLGCRPEISNEIESLILRLTAKGRSMRSIAIELNESGVMTARGGRWHPCTIQTVLNRNKSITRVS